MLELLTIYGWSFVASAAAISAEVIFLHSKHYMDTFPIPAILALIVNFGIWKMMEAGRSITTALVVFSLSNVILRILVALAQRKPLHWSTWTALGLLVAANVVKNIPKF
jgi:hypothetical protein